MAVTVDTLIKSPTILTMNAKREVIWKGAIAIQGEKILEVGEEKALAGKYQARRVIDGRLKLAMPGFINAHNHMSGALTRGLIDDVTFTPWIQKKFYLSSKGLNAENYYYSTLLLGIEMLKSGTTCFVDCGTMGGLEASVVKGVEDVGIKGVLGRNLMDITETLTRHHARWEKTTRENLKKGEAFVKDWHGAAGGRVQCWLCPLQVSSCTDELFVGASRIADRLGVGVLTHAAVATADVELCVERFHQTPVERFHRLGVLAPNFLPVHMGWLTEREVKLLRDARVSVIHAPTASMKCGYGSLSMGKFPEMLSDGINLCMGTDGPTASGCVDMFLSVFAAAVGHKEARLDPIVLRPIEALEMATRNGARALLWEDRTGSLEKGKCADIVLVDLKQPQFIPHHPRTLISHLVYGGSRAAVETVFVNGKAVVENGKVTTVDEDAVWDETQKWTNRYLRLSDEWDRKNTVVPGASKRVAAVSPHRSSGKRRSAAPAGK